MRFVPQSFTLAPALDRPISLVTREPLNGALNTQQAAAFDTRDDKFNYATQRRKNHLLFFLAAALFMAVVAVQNAWQTTLQKLDQ